MRARRRTSVRLGSRWSSCGRICCLAPPRRYPRCLSYRVLAEGGSRYNTPPVFGVYLIRLVLRWLRASGRAGGRGGAERAASSDALRRDRPHGLLPRCRRARQPLSDERDIPSADRRSRCGFRPWGQRRRARRRQGAPLGRGIAGVHLQRDAGRWSRGAGPVHAGVRAHAWMTMPREAVFCEVLGIVLAWTVWFRLVLVVGARSRRFRLSSYAGRVPGAHEHTEG